MDLKSHLVKLSVVCVFVSSQSVAEMGERQVAGLAAAMITASPTAFEALDGEFGILSSSEKNRVVREMRRIRTASLDGIADAQVVEEARLIERLLSAIGELAGDRFLGELPADEIDSIAGHALRVIAVGDPIEAEAMESLLGERSALVRGSCVLHSYPQIHAGATPNVSTQSAVSIGRAVNEQGEFPCDYEAQFSTARSNVFGATYPAYRLIRSSDGYVISRTHSGRDRLLFGFWSSNIWLGPRTMTRLKEDIKIF